jgi:outer membrane receptor protein involved in Fe transport
MNSKPHPYPIDRAWHLMAIGLAALITVTPAFAQSADSDSLRRLQEENAALRKRIAELEGPKAPAPATPAAPTPAAEPAAEETTVPVTTSRVVRSEDGEDVVVLSPFEVSGERDFGYLKTNSVTATRIGTEIQKVPMNISVISEDFIRDTNMQDIQDVLRYQSSSAGDGRMGILQPATGFTPSGIMTLRGFPINSRLRNGILRYSGYSLDNVDRVEIIKGPAAVFFGNAFPGGVINYVTKQPQFHDIPTSLRYGYKVFDERMGGSQLKLDHNTVFSDKAAMRIVSVWDNQQGNARYEYKKGYSINTGLTLIPFESGRLRIALEGEILKKENNTDDDAWRWPTQWFADYANPPANLIAAAGLSGNANPVAAYRARIFANVGAWIGDVRNAAGDQRIPLWTQPLEHGAYYTDLQGNRVYDPKFNYYGIGTFSKDENATFSITTDFAAADWLDVRHTYTNVMHRFDRIFSTFSPNADGMTFGGGQAATMQGYEIDANYHQLDLVFKAQFAGIDNKILVGGFLGETYNSFYGNFNHANIFPNFGYLPGAYDKPDEGYVSPIPAAFRHPVPSWGGPLQFIRNRNGGILTPQQIFSMYDPSYHTAPDVRRITEVSRGLVDHSRPTREEWYVNWQGTMFDDRLTAFLGYREEEISTVGQLVATNPPWYTVPDFALENIPQSEWVTYGLSAIFSRPRITKGDSQMTGFSFELKKNVNVYASFSKTFIPSGVTYLGGDYDPNTVRTRATAIGLNPDTELARVEAEGGLTEIENERGQNIEVGVKVTTDDQKFVGTLSFFRLKRENRAVDDQQRQFDEPLNWTGPNRTGTQYSPRTVRWYTASAVEQTEGAEFELFWTPKRNWQTMVSGAWMWDAETVSDASLAVLPNSPLSTIIQNEITFSERLVNAPEFRFNVRTSYTFLEDFVGEHGRGLNVGVGARYASEMNIQNNVNMWSGRGGITAGNYVVFETSLRYPFELFGYQFEGMLNIDNIFDKVYSEGNFGLAPPRSILLTLGMQF